ncbi:MAG: efflux RND transporter periplasmic adaptor subunit [Dissulfurispiraceae bacterium]|jgi:membrane fusion protein (multidrug efflux system)|nr:efflux RND transporter periplasmic adaptor subunit [Dissulfurispiraceae bacterium]
MRSAQPHIKRNRFATILVILTLLAFVAAAGCKKNNTAAMSPAGPPEVGIVEIKAERLELTTELPGRTAPHIIAEVRPQVGGIIQKRLFTEGTDVKEGDVLYQIDPASYQAAYNSAKAALARSEANLTPAKLRAERFAELVKINAISKQEYDDASAQHMQAKAEVEASKAALDTARINLGYTKITAPISGKIGRSAVTTGALVSANQTAPLAIIQQLDPIYVDITQSSSDMLKLKQAMASGLLKKPASDQPKVRLMLEDGSKYPLEGRLRFSEVTVDQSTASITLRTVFPNPHGVLLPGMFVRATVMEGINDRAILVLQRGVTRNPAGEAIVMVVGTENKVEPRVIKTARAVGDRWLVTEGLKPGDRVIVEGIQRTGPGSIVKPVLFESKTTAEVKK